ncbi:MAG: ABC transporter ATP-binding protein, partial [Planctomycetales bacterium]|nr:ABC transporter ATP-binding protein [Planctomycetales bacterium]
NGAGKTTTIKMMVGLLQPTAGAIRICEHDVVADTRQANLHVGYVPDQPYLYDKLTGRETLEFIAEMYGLAGREAQAEIQRQIELFDLAEFVDQLTENYSHGMKQRTVFAAAMVHRPQVLIVDEPMVGLDPRSMRLVKDLLRREAASGTTVFMSTHTLAVAEEIADTIGIVDHGRLQFLGSLQQLRDKLESHETSLEHLFLRMTEERPGDSPNGDAAALGAVAPVEWKG